MSEALGPPGHEEHATVLSAQLRVAYCVPSKKRNDLINLCAPANGWALGTVGPYPGRPGFVRVVLTHAIETSA